MSRTHLWAWAVVVCLFSVPMVCAQSQPASDGSSGPSSVAAVPRLIKFNGAVRDARGEPLGNIAVRLTFAVYEEQQGGAALWAETQAVEPDEQGHYTVLLGATRADGLPVELFPAGKARWLGVQVEGRDEDLRVLLVSVPYALKAEDAAMLGGRRASDFVLGEQLKEEVRTQVAAQTPGIATQAVEMLVSNPPKVPAIAEGPSTFTCATSGDCVAVTQSGTGHALRTTATSTTEAVLVQQNGTGYGLRALSPGNIAVLGQVTGSAGTSYGVKGQTTSTTGAGVFGYNLAATGLAYGVLGQTASTEGTAFFGRAVATTGATIGLRGHADSTSGTGIMGQATATSGVTIGIVGRVFSATGTALIVDNTKGGKLLSGQVNGAERFSIAGSGNLASAGTLSGTQFISTVASGTAPLSVTSNTLVPNLNADLLDGLHAVAFQPAGPYATLGTNTFTTTQTISTGDLSVSSGNISLPQTTSASAGVINLGGTPFIHAYGSGNTFVGSNAGNFTTTGGWNTASGYQALYSNTTGIFNTASGAQALYSNTTGIFNTASGFWTLYSNTTGSNNTASGAGALHSNTTGWGNTAGGFEALQANTTGILNTATGANALHDNTTGQSNTASGFEALKLNTTGNFNTASGFEALLDNTQGSSNTASGMRALGVNTEGTDNTASGYQALNNNTTGGANSALGVRSGYNNSTGYNNTFIGFQAGPDSGELTNATAIGANAVVSQSNSLILGGTGEWAVNVGIGTAAPAATLDVVGNIHSSGSVTATSFVGPLSGIASDLNCTGCVSPPEVSFNYAGSSTQGGAATSALAADSATTAGNASNLGGVAASNFARWDTANSFTQTQTISSGDLSVSSGNISLPQTASASAGVINLGGSPFLHACCDSNLNTFVGANAGNFTTTGNLNTAAGSVALYSNTTGGRNTASGYSALYSNTTGYYNTASGAQALYSNTTGYYNAATGTEALSYNTSGYANTASGRAALYANSTAHGNTAGGYSALYLNCSGVPTGCTANYNTALGYYAGVTSTSANANVTGANNTFLGASSGPGTSTQLTNATAIGANAVVSASNSLVLGSISGVNGATASVNVGIGTTTPAHTLDVLGDIHSSGSVTATSFSGGGSLTGTQLISTAASGTAPLSVASNTLVPNLNADLLDGLHAVAFQPAGSYATLGANTFTAGQTISSGDLTVSSGNVGIGTATPAAKLDVKGNSTSPIVSVSQTGSGNGIEASTAASGSSTAYKAAIVGTATASYAAGVEGISSDPNGIAVIGYNTGTTGALPAVGGFTNSNSHDAVAVMGVALATTGATRGLVAEAYSPDGTGGLFRNTGGGWVIRGGNATTDVFTVDASGNMYISGNTQIDGNVNIAGSLGNFSATGAGFSGNVNVGGDLHVTGAISAGTKDFKIDDPLDPDHKFLYHASVESSEMMDMYTGNVTTDAHGEAVVQLPAWFQALNRDFRYQLTVIGQFAQAIVAQEIANNRFMIKTDKAKVKVSWQVTGVRHDAYAKAHPLQVEVDKPERAP